MKSCLLKRTSAAEAQCTSAHGGTGGRASMFKLVKEASGRDTCCFDFRLQHSVSSPRPRLLSPCGSKSLGVITPQQVRGALCAGEVLIVFEPKGVSHVNTTLQCVQDVPDKS